jgi:hypothetical protein
MLDCAVLARRVHRLEYDQQRPAVLRIEHLLLVREQCSALLEQISRLAFVQL